LPGLTNNNLDNGKDELRVFDNPWGAFLIRVSAVSVVAVITDGTGLPMAVAMFMATEATGGNAENLVSGNPGRVAEALGEGVVNSMFIDWTPGGIAPLVNAASKGRPLLTGMVYDKVADAEVLTGLGSKGAWGIKGTGFYWGKGNAASIAAGQTLSYFKVMVSAYDNISGSHYSLNPAIWGYRAASGTDAWSGQTQANYTP
jgi:hypothetical protein